MAVVLDIGLPGRDGIEVLASLRAEQDWTPVLVVTARDEETDRITGLELGADDYVTKPFSPRELVARVRAILRRQDGRPGARVLEHGALRLDPERRIVTVDGAPVPLTATEFNLLEALLAAGGRALGRAELLARAWGQADYGDQPDRRRPRRAAARQARPRLPHRDRARRRLPDGLVMSSLRTRLALAMAAVVVLTILLAAVATGPLLRASTEGAARQGLGREADLLARLPVAALGSGRAGQVAAGEDLQLGLVSRTGATSGAAQALTGRQLARLRAGEPVSTTARLGGAEVLVEARPSRLGGAVVLAADASTLDDTVARQRRRVFLALVLGLLGGLVVAGLVAGWIARPLGAAASAARRLAAGERGVPLPDASVRELADMTDALGHLDSALSSSEQRQRRFLLSVSHELRTPLTSVRGYAEALADGTIEPHETAQVGETLVAEAARLERYVGDLLALARLQADDFAVHADAVDLRALLADRGGRLGRPRRTRRADRRGRRPRRPGAARDRRRPGATGARRPGRQRRPGLPRGEPDRAGARRRRPTAPALEVRDSGPGLTADDAAVAFEPGVLHDRYADRGRGGFGLGLAIVHGLVRRLGGTIAVATAPEGGAAFVIDLPTRHIP